MRANLLAAALLLLAPLAQAQSWTQLLASAGADISLPPAPGPVVAPDGAGLIFVQTFNQNGPASPLITVHALGNDGLLRPGLSTDTVLPVAYPLFSPQAISARNGHRAVVFQMGWSNLLQHYVHQYRPGETTFHSGVGFQHGAALSRVTVDGAGSAYITRELSDLPDRPTLFYYGNHQQHFRRYYGGCSVADYLPVTLLDADFTLDEGGPITALTRCLDVSSPGTLALNAYDRQTGALLSMRHSWPYADSAAPVVAAFAIGNGRYVVEQADAASGARTARIIDGEGDGQPLPLPPEFQLRQVLRQDSHAVLIAADPDQARLGRLRIAGKKVDWVAFNDDVPAVANLALAWSSDREGDLALAYRRPQPGGGDLVQIYEIDTEGSVIAKRSILGQVPRPAGRVVLSHEPLSNEIVLAADVVQPDGRAAVYLQQFPVESGIATLPWPPVP